MRSLFYVRFKQGLVSSAPDRLGSRSVFLAVVTAPEYLSNEASSITSAVKVFYSGLFLTAYVPDAYL